MRIFLLLFMALAVPASGLTPAEIDAALAKGWAARGLSPSAPAGDLVFLRRAYLDLVGVIPSMAAVASYRADTGADRRKRLVDLLLSTSRFSDHWGEVLYRMVVGRTVKLDNGLSAAFQHWLSARLASKVGVDRIVREIVAAEGTALDNPAIAPLYAFEDSKEDMAGHFARVFLGVQIQCAQCHDHPFETWKQADFHGFTALFARSRRANLPTAAIEKMRAGELTRAEDLAGYFNRKIDLKRAQQQMDRLRDHWMRAGLDPLAYRGARTVAEAAESMEMSGAFEQMKKAGQAPKEIPALFEALEGEYDLPRKPDEATGPGLKRPVVKPRFLDGTTPVHPDRGMARRDRLAAWMTAPANPWFARAIVNRVWARMMGRGLTEPIDNVSQPSDATHRALQDQLAAHFVASGYDLRGLISLIVSTDAYQRSVVPNATNAKDTQYFSRALARPLEPEQVFASILEATGVEHTFKDGQGPQLLELKKRFERQFVFAYANDEPGETVAYQGTVAQALFTLNSPAFNKPVRADPGGTIDGLKSKPGDPAERITGLMLRTLTREPTPAELARLTAFLQKCAADPTWGTKRPASPAPPPKPGARVPAVRRMEAMWRAYEDVLWSMIASTEFQVNH